MGEESRGGVWQRSVVKVEDDLEFYTRRERQARELAAAATHSQNRAAHLQMAEAYARLRMEAALSATAGSVSPRPAQAA